MSGSEPSSRSEVPSANDSHRGLSVAEAAEQFGWPSTDEVRDRLQKAIRDAMDDRRNVIIEAVTSSGKTHNGATTPWSNLHVTGGEPVLQFHGTTNAREDAEDKSEAADVEYRVLQGRDEVCDTADDEHDDEVDTPDGSPASEWIDRHCGSASGTTFSTAHSHLENINDGDLPCTPCKSPRGQAPWHPPHSTCELMVP